MILPFDYYFCSSLSESYAPLYIDVCIFHGRLSVLRHTRVWHYEVRPYTRDMEVLTYFLLICINQRLNRIGVRIHKLFNMCRSQIGVDDAIVIMAFFKETT